MSALVLKSINHLYKIFKVYFTLALIGALAVIAYEVFVSKPVVILIGFGIIGALVVSVMLWVEGIPLRFNLARRVVNDVFKKNPRLP
jgi:hypothetical protein